MAHEQDALRERLAQRRSAAIETLRAIEADLEALRAMRQRESDDDEHDPDGVPLSEEWSRLEGLHASAMTAVADVDAAIARLDDGTYSRCVSCGREIDPRRLAARPAARTCIDCATR